MKGLQMPGTPETVMHELPDVLLSDYVISTRLTCGQGVLSRTNLLQDNQKLLL